jgi:hypothetical protein
MGLATVDLDRLAGLADKLDDVLQLVSEASDKLNSEVSWYDAEHGGSDGAERILDDIWEKLQKALKLLDGRA